MFGLTAFTVFFYAVLACFVICSAYIGFSAFRALYKKDGLDGVSGDKNKILQAEGKVPAQFITPSVFNHWTWVTTIIGSAEASILYGVSGAIAYSVGSSIGFLVMILILTGFKKLMPDGIFITDFIKGRFSERTRTLFYILSVSIVIYIQIEVAVGLGFVFNGLFGISFKVVAFISVTIAIVFAATSGIRKILYNDLISFVLITGIFLTIVLSVIHKFDINFLYSEISGKILMDSKQVSKDFFNIFAMGGFRYLIAAVFIGIGQTILDPSYYFKSYITDRKDGFHKSFLTGGILMFMPIPILSGFIFGFTSIASGYDFSSAENISVLIAGKMILEHFGPWMRILTGALLFLIAITTLISSSIGIMTLAALDIYPNKIDGDGDEGDGIRFSRMFMTVIVGVSGLLAISLEKISLLNIDIFCGIVFTATFSVILMGFLSKKKIEDFAAVAGILGASLGFMSWISNTNESVNYLYGILLSFMVPILILGTISLFTKEEFNFYSLNNYN